MQPSKHTSTDYSAVKKHIQRGDLDGAFKALSAQLPATSDYTAEWVQLESGWMSLKSEVFAGTISFEQKGLEEARITNGLMALLTNLQQSSGRVVYTDNAQGELDEIQKLLRKQEYIPLALARLEPLLTEELPEEAASIHTLLIDFQMNRDDYVIKRIIDREEFAKQRRLAIYGAMELIQKLRTQNSRIKGTGVKRGSILSAHNCDRKKILMRFTMKFEQKEEDRQPLHIYTLVHAKYGQSESLVRRLITNLHHDFPNQVKYAGWSNIHIQEIDLEPCEDLSDAQHKFRKAVVHGLNSRARNLQILMEEIEQGREPRFLDATYLPFPFRIKLRPEQWTTFGEKALRWFVEQYCQLPQRLGQVPILFLVVELSETIPAAEEKSRGFSIFRRKPKEAATPVLDPHEELASILVNFSDTCTLLPPLKLVVENDLKDWYRTYESNERTREQKVTEITQQLGPPTNGEGWPMGDVIPILQALLTKEADPESPENKYAITK